MNRLLFWMMFFAVVLIQPGFMAAVPAETPAVPAGVTDAWWSKVQADLQKEEYHITWQDHTSLSDLEAAWQAPNRSQGFRTYFTESGIRLVPRTREMVGWEWGLEFLSGADDNAVISVTGNRVEYVREEIIEWYINEPRGLEQGFTILKPLPADKDDRSLLQIDLKLTGNLHPRFSSDGQGIDFYFRGGINRLRYSGLKATDAVGRVLASRFEGINGGIRILVDDRDAIYPVMVDPLTTGPAWTVEGDQADARFGISVSTAGDVNGDGHSDVIVGAHQYDSGEENEGKVFVFYGKPSGLSNVAAWTAESDQSNALFGWNAGTAGDVNGDGYSDVIVGAVNYDDLLPDEGKAFVYHGSAYGLSPAADWTARGDQDSAHFAWFLGTAGDVNGDGYSDVIIGAANYYDPLPGEGRAFVYHGSPSGLNPGAAWTAKGGQSGAAFGNSVATAGDVNGDGYSDVIVGAYTFDNTWPDEGKAFVFHGSASGLDSGPAWTDVGGQDHANFGCQAVTAGDVNGDGYSDIIVGAYGYDNGEIDEGRAFVYLGSASGLDTSAAWTTEGDQNGAQFGAAVAPAGDVNGDGYGDVIVGAHAYDNGETNEGGAFLYLGSASGLESVAAWMAEGNQSDVGLGGSVATAGDVNGDGYSDVVIGASGYNGSTGRAYLHTGSAAGLSEWTSWTGTGEAASNALGCSVVTAGDVNGDGYSDVVVGAYMYDSYSGKVYLYPGGATGLSDVAAWTVTGEAVNDEFGYSVASAGDVNGDGYSDVIVGARGHNGGIGKAYLYTGSESGLPGSATWTSTGEAAGSAFGCSVVTAGDANGDGYSDVVVGAYGYNSNTGKVYLYQGGPSGIEDTASWSTSGETAGDYFGISVATAGDVNGDGYSDVMVGADGAVAWTGKAYLFTGGDSGLSDTATWTGFGEAVDSYYGYSVATAGDINGDGYSDVLVGAIGYSSSIGKVYLYMGGESGLEADASWTDTGEAAFSTFGRSVMTAGDVNGDGFSDVIVGSDGASGWAGRAYLYYGGESGLSGVEAWTGTGEAANDYFGFSVSTAGDVNGDGYSDVVIGAVRYAGWTGKTYLYYGNGEAGGGFTLLPRQVRTDLTTPIAPLGRAGDGQFYLSMIGRTPFGRGDVKLEWQIAPLGGSFSPVLNPYQTSVSWTDSGDTSTTLTRALLLAEGDGPYLWRMRTRYHAATTPLQSHGPWKTLVANGMRETDLRRLPACAPPDEPVWIYQGSPSGPYATFHFQDPNQSDQRTGWNVRRTDNPVQPKEEWPLVGTNVVDMDEATPNYQWTDSSGDPGTWFYQVTTFNAFCPAEGPF